MRANAAAAAAGAMVASSRASSCSSVTPLAASEVAALPADLGGGLPVRRGTAPPRLAVATTPAAALTGRLPADARRELAAADRLSRVARRLRPGGLFRPLAGRVVWSAGASWCLSSRAEPSKPEGAHQVSGCCWSPGTPGAVAAGAAAWVLLVTAAAAAVSRPWPLQHAREDSGWCIWQYNRQAGRPACKRAWLAPLVPWQPLQLPLAVTS